MPEVARLLSMQGVEFVRLLRNVGSPLGSAQERPRGLMAQLGHSKRRVYRNRARGAQNSSYVAVTIISKVIKLKFHGQFSASNVLTPVRPRGVWWDLVEHFIKTVVIQIAAPSFYLVAVSSVRPARKRCLRHGRPAITTVTTLRSRNAILQLLQLRPTLFIPCGHSVT